MPTIVIEGYRFGFWSADCGEPPHVHVTRDGKRAKTWLSPIGVASFRGYNERELNWILKLVRAHHARLLECGMNTATKSNATKVRIGVDLFEDTADEVIAVSARVTGETLCVTLSDGREISYPLSSRWMHWLAKAEPEQRANWQIEPGGWAIYWPDLDDGIEVAHLLSTKPIC